MSTQKPTKIRKLENTDKTISLLSPVIPLEEERVVSVSKLFSARAREIKQLHDDVKNSGRNKRAFQLLPRHLRRRTMSHNPYRIPSRKLREKALREIASAGNVPQKKKRKYRKQKRRCNRLLRDYGKRQLDKKWLETHVWHAKRFHMFNLWGYRIARTACNKGKR
eukprot:TRINITY_DN15475_c0_g1_i2.p1 TRINITY_DN15475_c0_g1~~TRINITY_DN15475_c0_g1_i2.p1  ORF type:complete len:165 (-),score=45.17 TRINITY_DN15475_c0_g1_i2:95-589(-)